MSASSPLYYLHDDRLGTPQLVTDSVQNVVWSTAYQPYGTTEAVTGSVIQNLRLPGQYADSETGFYQNGFRDYMPTIGKYLEADPIGLAGGTNRYAYASESPGVLVDPYGLWGFGAGGGIYGSGGIGSTAGGVGTVYSTGGVFITSPAWWNPFTWTTTFGADTSNGIGYYGPWGGHQNPTSGCRVYSVGLAGSLGKNFYITTANNSGDLAGNATTEQYDLGLFSISVTTGFNSAGQEITTWGFGFSFGFGHSVYPTYTSPLF